jgi:hypothetical protein
MLQYGFCKPFINRLKNVIKFESFSGMSYRFFREHSQIIAACLTSGNPYKILRNHAMFLLKFSCLKDLRFFIFSIKTTSRFG